MCKSGVSENASKFFDATAMRIFLRPGNSAVIRAISENLIFLVWHALIFVEHSLVFVSLSFFK